MKNHIQPANTNRLANTLLSQLIPRVSRNQRCLVALSMFVWLLLASVTSFGGSATWNLNSNSGDWGDPNNWTPATVPNGPADTATFGVSNITDLQMNEFEDEVNGIVFAAGASQFTISVLTVESFAHVLTISGVGISNNSGLSQNFVAVEDFGGGRNGVIQFTNSATAGDLTVFTANTQSASGLGGEIKFFGASTAGSATLIGNDCGGSCSGGLIMLADDSNAGTARIEVFGKGTLDISAHNAPGVTIGSIEGTGTIILGANNLTVGNNNLSTNFAGVIRDAGSLTKIGTGKLTLSGSNKYSGGTIVNDGTLLVNNKRTSGTGKRPVQVNAGTLGGTGKIGGAVTIGTGSGSGAFLSPGVDAASHRTLTIKESLTFSSDATYRCGFNSGTAQTDRVVATGVSINSGAQFSFEDSNGSGLPLGTVLTVIDNTAGNPIRGTFSNLADGSNITVGSNTFQASYTGGDGNNLTLTVVP